MESKCHSTVVEMPDGKLLDVTYYFMGGDTSSKPGITDLYVQLDDCLCILKIDRLVASREDELERLVHNKVIHEKGHLC